MEEAEWWQLKAKLIEEKARASSDSLATVAAQFLSGGDVNAELWGRYLDHFVARLYPCAAAAEMPLQHKVLRAWLAAKLSEVDPSSWRKVASLHAVAQYEETLLAALAACIDPLATLAPADELSQHIVGVINGASDVEVELNVAIVRAFYQLMRQIAQGEEAASDAPQLLQWAKAVGQAKLHTIPVSARGIDFKQIDAMLVMQTIATSRVFGGGGAGGGSAEHSVPGMSDDANTISCIRSMIIKLHALVVESSVARLSPAEMWRTVEQHGALAADATLCSRLAEGWLGSAPESEADVRYLLGTVFVSAALITPHRTPLLETLLLGHHPQQQKAIKAIASPSGSLLAWMEALQDRAGLRVTELLEQQLGAEAASCPVYKGQPPWFQEPCDPHSVATEPLTKAYFQVVWKWMLLRHASDGLSELAGLAQELQTSRKLAAVPIQRALALSAVRVMLIDQVAARIVSDQEGSLLCDGDEADRFLGQLESMADADSVSAPFWAGELALAVCAKLTDVDRGRQLLEARAASELQIPNLVVATWLQDALKILGDDSPINPSAFQGRRPPLVLQTLPAILGSQTGGVDAAQKFVRELVSRRERLRLLWLIPDLLEFYHYITNTCEPAIP